MSSDSDASMAALTYRLINKTIKQWVSIRIRGFDHSRLTSKFTTIHSIEVLAVVANSFSKQSPKSEICTAKYWNSGGEGCIIRVYHHPTDSAATDGSLELDSPAWHNIPAASDESVLNSKNKDGEGHPPPDRTLLDIERGVGPPQAERRFNPSSMAKLCLFVSCEVYPTPSLIRYNASTSLSANANALLLFAELFGVVGFILCFGAYICQRRRRAPGVMIVMGGLATISGLLSILGRRFPEKAILWLTAALWALPISTSPFALCEMI